ncbi:MAG: class I SAM-dependent methyltransferase [Bacteroidetes bacterium]|nr:class I SAM-dependent methyltransferase [Bacteroidota bacterium]MDA0851603.1 class I SAM-dependent methyltransferase [Pseudomonadota bacterium]
MDQEKIVGILEGAGPFLSKSYQSAVTLNGMSWRDAFLMLISKTFKTEEEFQAAIKGYKKFIFESMRLQEEFNDSGRYQCTGYQEALDTTYNDMEYMLSEYLPGLFLSNFLWPHHVRQHNFYTNQFLSELKPRSQEKQLKFCDVGVGTGYYSLMTFEELSHVSGTAYDISDASLAFANQLIARNGYAQNFEAKKFDILTENTLPKFDFVICNEVLEHLERPQDFIHCLGEMLEDGGKMFLTAALNAANRDHIYLYEGIEDIRNQVLESGLKILSSGSFYAYGGASRSQRTPEVAAFIIAR